MKISYAPWSALYRAMYVFVALAPLLQGGDQSSRGLVDGLPQQVQQQQQQQQQPMSNITIPGLSERASNINSRYLSAASTASLAAATVAASNSASNSPTPVSNANTNGNSHDLARTFAIQQQQQQPQQPTLVSNNPNNNPASQTQTQTATASQYNSAQTPLTLSHGTPVMSSTFTYNPLTGQFIPTEISTGSTGNMINPIGPVQQQQSQPLQPFNPYPPNLPFATSSFAYRPPSLIGPSGYPIHLNQRPLSSVSQFNRRTGLANQANSLRNQNPGVIYVANQDDEGTFYPQQVGFGLNTLTSNNNGDFNAGSTYGGGLDRPFAIPSSLPVYNQQQRPQQAGYLDYNQLQLNQMTPQPTSLSSIGVLPSPSSSAAPQVSSTTSEYKNDQCVAADNRHGTCYQASECIRRGGTPMGKCGTSMNSNEISGSSYVCCLFDITCGQIASERFVYFRNPGYPNTFDQNRMCRARIGKLDRSVCQYRLDMIRFDVAKPTNGNCSNDMFVVSGQNENYVIPKICGLNDGQHYYVGVDESGVITLHMMMMGFYRRSFEILVTQIPCRSDYSAPAHCLQYYMGTHGTIKSFNYDDDEHLASQASSNNYVDLINQQQLEANTLGIGGPVAPYGIHFNNYQSNGLAQLQQRQALLTSASNRYANDFYGGYPNDLDYTMCIRKESGFCSITYQLSRGEQGLQPFAVGQSLFGANGLNNDSLISSNGLGGAAGGGWQPVSTECRDDYLLVGGVRLCSGGSSDPLTFQSTYDSSIQFAQNGSVLNAAGINQAGSQQLQLQNQLNSLVQQLDKIQLLQQQQQQQHHQQQQLLPANSSYTSQQQLSSSSSSQGGNLSNQNNNNLEQQRASIIQLALATQQQLNQIASGGGNYLNQQQGSTIISNNRIANDASHYASDLHGAIITDTTSGPFILRFVSNTARNARGFHIDYRQNPCK